MILTTAQKLAAYLEPILDGVDMENVTREDLFRWGIEGGFADAKRSDLEEALRIIMGAWNENETANDK